MHLHDRLGKGTVAALLCAALTLSPALAFAASTDTVTVPTPTPTQPAPTDPTPTQPTPTEPTPTKPAPTTPAPKTTTPAPKTSTPAPKTETQAPKSPSKDTGSAIPTPLTPEQKRFRDELAKRQARLDALQAQLDELDAQLEIATENYNQATAQLADTKKRLSLTQTDLDNAEKAYEEQLKLLTDRIRTMYRGDGLDGVTLLLESKSVSDFVQRIEFLNLVGQKDADLAAQLAQQRDSIQQSLLGLKDAKLQAEQLEFNLKARRIEIQLRIQERQQMLTSTQSDLTGLLGQQAAQRSSEEAALLKQILAGAASVGVTVQAGTPVETALAYHGIPYVWGGATPSGFDCSGLVMYVFQQHGVNLPHYSGSQYELGVPVGPNELQPNDVVFFGTTTIHHVGIYMGNDYFIEAPHTGSYVRVARLSTRSDYAGARRYPWTLRVAPIWGVSGPAGSVGSLLPN